MWFALIWCKPGKAMGTRRTQPFNSTGISPLVFKIIGLFLAFIVFSNFVTNLLNSAFSRGELIKLEQQLLVKDLREIYNFSGTQFEIFQHSIDSQQALLQASEAFRENSMRLLHGNKSLCLAVKVDGSLLYSASRTLRPDRLNDKKAIQTMFGRLNSGSLDGMCYFRLFGSDYLAVYKYSEKWDAMFLRAEALSEFYRPTQSIILRVSLFIFFLIITFAFVGNYMLRYLLRNLDRDIPEIDLDSIPHLLIDTSVPQSGQNINILPSRVTSLLHCLVTNKGIDPKFTPINDEALQLNGNVYNAVILCCDALDLRGTLTDLDNEMASIISTHYKRMINHAISEGGVIRSQPGEAFFAIFRSNKDGKTFSHSALRAALLIRSTIESLKWNLSKRKDFILASQGELRSPDEFSCQRLLGDVGVGIDYSTIFSGQLINSNGYNIAIAGERVSVSACLSRMAGVYNIPILCSHFFKIQFDLDAPFSFVEVDCVAPLPGKEPERVYWPISKQDITPQLQTEISFFESGLSFYYQGDISSARDSWRNLGLPFIDLFRKRLVAEESIATDTQIAVRDIPI